MLTTVLSQTVDIDVRDRLPTLVSICTVTSIDNSALFFRNISTAETDIEIAFFLETLKF